MTRERRAKRAAELKAQGLNGIQIARRMRISRTYAYALLTDPDGSGDRERKKQYGGTCGDCGAPTNGSDGRANAPKYCRTCSARRTGEANRVWTKDLLLARIREWAATHGEPPAVPDWNPSFARKILHDEARALRFEDADGYWPWFITVFRAFGSWNDGLREAGFVPRSPHGGDGNGQRRRSLRAEAERVAA